MPSELPYGLSVERSPHHDEVRFGQPIPRPPGTPRLPVVYIYADGTADLGRECEDIDAEALLTWARLLVEQLEEATR